MEETNAAEHYERTKFDLYDDDICLVLTLTYVLMDNFLSLFYLYLDFCFFNVRCVYGGKIAYFMSL